MPYEFFFSYTRGNSDSYLKEFFKDLSEDVRVRRGLPETTVVGFLDQHDIELGGTWENTIANALQDSKVMVSMYSPGYFQSPYCGKEWEVFMRRCKLFRDRKVQAGELGAQLPPSIKPSLWVPFSISNLAEEVQAIQYLRGDQNPTYAAEGLRYILTLKTDYRREYTNFVTALAKDIIETADKYSLPQLEPLPPLEQVDSAWPQRTPQGGQSPVAPVSVSGPKHIRFVFVAADPHHFGDVRSAAPYLDRGGPDWKPFFPDMSAIGPFVQHIVSDQELGFTSDELTFSPNLVSDIEDAWADRKIVIILVDGWSVNWDTGYYQEVLQNFDKQNFFNCSVLVPWNDQDPFITKEGQTILQTLKKTFYFKGTGNPIFYRDSIRKPEDLRDALRDVLTRIKAVIRSEAKISRPVPRDKGKPVISGPGPDSSASANQ
jgi:FxsC-like protein